MRLEVQLVDPTLCCGHALDYGAQMTPYASASVARLHRAAPGLPLLTKNGLNSRRSHLFTRNAAFAHLTAGHNNCQFGEHFKICSIEGVDSLNVIGLHGRDKL